MRWIGLLHPSIGEAASSYINYVKSLKLEICPDFLRGIILAVLVFELEKGNCKKSEEAKETNDSRTNV